MFKLINKVNKARHEVQQVTENTHTNLTILAETQNQTADILAENVTQVLADIATAAQQGDELKLMHVDSIAAFMAGVEMLAHQLPEQSPEKATMTMRVLSAASVDPEGYVTYATTPVVQLGARNEPSMQKFNRMVRTYVQSQTQGRPDGTTLAQAARQLQANIERAMRTSQESQSKNLPGETTFDPNVVAAQRG